MPRRVNEKNEYGAQISAEKNIKPS